MATSVIKRIKDTAERLYDLRQRIREIEEATQERLASLKIERDAVEKILLTDLAKNELKSIKVSSGESFIRKVSKALEITSLPHALDWAIKHRTVSINKTLVKQKLKDVEEMPDGFALVESEYISITKPKHESTTNRNN